MLMQNCCGLLLSFRGPIAKLSQQNRFIQNKDRGLQINGDVEILTREKASEALAI